MNPVDKKILHWGIIPALYLVGWALSGAGVAYLIWYSKLDPTPWNMIVVWLITIIGAPIMVHQAACNLRKLQENMGYNGPPPRRSMCQSRFDLIPRKCPL